MRNVVIGEGPEWGRGVRLGRQLSRVFMRPTEFGAGLVVVGVVHGIAPRELDVATTWSR
ncbi:MAG: hypothetical protein R2839_03980 [Thermomicrobiales bacterium]